jgi:uncharacterized protein DUF5681
MTDETKTPTAEAISERKPDGRFKPGVSGNPNGRPSIVKEVRTMLQEQVGKNIEVLVAIRDNPDAKDADRIACIKEINDRALGRAAQAVEHSGNIGSGANPEDHKPDMANRLAGLRERVIAETAAERQAAVTTAVAGQDGQTIQ